jgi:hypothetical protein
MEKFQTNTSFAQSVGQYLGVRRPSGTRHQFYFLLEIFFRQLRVCNFVAPSLTRGRICNLLYNCSGPCQTSHFWIEVPQNSRPYFTVSSETPPTCEGQVPIFISPRNRVAQLSLQIFVIYEKCRPLGCDAVWVYYKPTFRRNMSPPSSGWKKWRERGKALDGNKEMRRRFIITPHGAEPIPQDGFKPNAVRASNFLVRVYAAAYWNSPQRDNLGYSSSSDWISAINTTFTVENWKIKLHCVRPTTFFCSAQESNPGRLSILLFLFQ